MPTKIPPLRCPECRALVHPTAKQLASLWGRLRHAQRVTPPKPGPGRPRSPDKPRCECGRFTAHMAAIRRHVCGSAEPREWIIQRCTQRWVGTELQYQDYLGSIGPIVTACAVEDLMAIDEMMRALDICGKSSPDELRGHNVMNCQCERHQHFVAPTHSQ